MQMLSRTPARADAAAERPHLRRLADAPAAASLTPGGDIRTLGLA